MRRLALALMAMGTLALADVAATLLWQEPLTAFAQDQRQGNLGEELERISLPEPAPASDPRARLASLSRSLRRSQDEGDPVGRVVIPSIGVEDVIVEGTSARSLREGPGHYPRSPLPGARGTVAVAGHRTTHGAPFADIGELGRGDRVELEMPYGRFTYEVEGNRIVTPDDVGVLKDVGRNRLVLTACHPKWSAAKRLVVFARLTGVDARTSSRPPA